MRPDRFVVISLMCLAGCGSMPPPPSTPVASSTSGAAGAAALAGDLSADAVVSADLAGIRADPVLAKILAQVETTASAEVTELLSRLDRIDARVDGSTQAPAFVAVLWGRFPSDPRGLPAFAVGARHEVAAAPALSSGVQEYVERGPDAAHVFVVRDGVWVMTAGRVTDRVRAHFASTSEPPVSPGGDLLHLKANHKVLARAKIDGELRGIDGFELALRRGMTSLKGVLSFKEEASAKEAIEKVRALKALLSMSVAVNTECKALEKIEIDVGRDTSNVSVELKGIGEAASAWDPAKCQAPAETNARVSVPEPVDASVSHGGAEPSVPTKKLCAVAPPKQLPSLSPKRQSSAPGRPPRERAILVTELDALEKLVSVTPRSSSDRSALVARLVFGYGEWTAAAKRDCSADRGARASAGDVSIGARVTRRVKELCDELKAGPPSSPQCR